MSFLDLLDGPLVVVAKETGSAVFSLSRSALRVPLLHWRVRESSKGRDSRSNWNITAVDHSGPAVEWVGIERDVVAAAESHFP